MKDCVNEWTQNNQSVDTCPSLLPFSTLSLSHLSLIHRNEWATNAALTSVCPRLTSRLTGSTSPPCSCAPRTPRSLFPSPRSKRYGKKEQASVHIPLDVSPEVALGRKEVSDSGRENSLMKGTPKNKCVCWVVRLGPIFYSCFCAFLYISGFLQEFQVIFRIYGGNAKVF